MDAAQEAGLDQRGGVHRRARVELAGIDALLTPPEIHLVQLELERLVEAALRQPPVQRHLAAFEALDAHARASGLALAATSAGLALARADAAADAHAILARSVPVGNLVEFHDSQSLLIAEHTNEMLHLQNHAARRRIIGQFLDAPDLVQPEPDQGRALRVMAPLRAADLLDLDALRACHDRYSALPPDGGLPQSAAASLSTPVRRACSAETLMLRRCATERGES